MAWTAKIVSTQKDKGRITIRVGYKNGSEEFEEEFYATNKVDMAWLAQQVRLRISDFKEAYAFADTLSKDQSIDLTEPVKPIPPQAEQDLESFLKDYKRWLSVSAAIEAGILTGEEPKVIELKTKVTTSFKPAYLQYM